MLELREKNGPGAIAELVKPKIESSIANGTWLSKNADIDIFIKFKKNISEEKLENISKKIGFTS